MDYKLAKQLKDARFPQEMKESYVLPPNTGEEYRHIMRIDYPVRNRNLLASGYELVAKPNLEELIKELGNKLGGISVIYDSDKKGANIEGYHAYESFVESCVEDCCPDSNAEAKTPTEAVAKLYLKLK